TPDLCGWIPRASPPGNSGAELKWSPSGRVALGLGVHLQSGPAPARSTRHHDETLLSDRRAWSCLARAVRRDASQCLVRGAAYLSIRWGSDSKGSVPTYRVLEGSRRVHE